MKEGKTIEAIREAVRSSRLGQPFKAADVNKAIGIDWAGNFMPKHCDQRTDKNRTWLFDQINLGLYRLTKEQQARCDAGL